MFYYKNERPQSGSLSLTGRYDDPHILAGQGTAALEVFEQMDKLGVVPDATVIPVGGGGLLAGMATAIKHLMPKIEVIVSSQLKPEMSLLEIPQLFDVLMEPLFDHFP